MDGCSLKHAPYANSGTSRVQRAFGTRLLFPGPFSCCCLSLSIIIKRISLRYWPTKISAKWNKKHVSLENGALAILSNNSNHTVIATLKIYEPESSRSDFSKYKFTDFPSYNSLSKVPHNLFFINKTVLVISVFCTPDEPIELNRIPQRHFFLSPILCQECKNLNFHFSHMPVSLWPPNKAIESTKVMKMPMVTFYDPTFSCFNSSMVSIFMHVWSSRKFMFMAWRASCTIKFY